MGAISDIDHSFWVVWFLFDLMLIFDILVIEFLSRVGRNDYLKLEEAYGQGQEHFAEYVRKRYLRKDANWDGVKAAEIISMAHYRQARAPMGVNPFEGMQWTALKIVVVLVFVFAIGLTLLGNSISGILIFAAGIIMVFAVQRIRVMRSWRERSLALLEKTSKGEAPELLSSNRELSAEGPGGCT